jgi:hypothetical protein
MKKIFLLFIISCTFLTQAQDPLPDSLVGIYVGNSYFKATESDSWTITADTQYVTAIDTYNCIAYTSGCFTNGIGFRDFFTEYSYCFGTPSWDPPNPLFYSNDSVKFIWDNIPYPPPSVHTFSKRFFGKRLPNTSYVGFKDIKPIKSRLRIYPNPTDELLFLDFSGLERENCSILIRNVFGSIVLKEAIASAKHSIDVSHFPKGIYFLEWNNGFEKGLDKFVVY